MPITFKAFFQGLARSTPVWTDALAQKAAYDENKRRFNLEYALREKEVESNINRNDVDIQRIQEETRQSKELFPIKKEELVAKVALDKVNTTLGEINAKIANKNFDQMGTYLKIAQDNVEIARANAVTDRDRVDVLKKDYVLNFSRILMLVNNKLMTPEKDENGVVKRSVTGGAFMKNVKSSIAEMIASPDAYENSNQIIGALQEAASYENDPELKKATLQFITAQMMARSRLADDINLVFKEEGSPSDSQGLWKDTLSMFGLKQKGQQAVDEAGNILELEGRISEKQWNKWSGSQRIRSIYQTYGLDEDYESFKNSYLYGSFRPPQGR